jgi:predicted ArsR family transcriptional regulator
VEQPTRERILEQIKRDGSGTIAGLSDSMGLAPSTIRQHLQILIQQDLVSREAFAKGRGRPETIYQLTSTGHERFARRHAELLEDLLQTLGSEGARELFAAATRRKIDELAHLRAVEDPDRRLELAIDHLPDLGKLHDREKIDNGLDLHLYDCPYSGVESAFPHVCHMVLDTLREITGASVELTEWLRSGGRKCTIKIRHSPSVTAQEDTTGEP